MDIYHLRVFQNHARDQCKFIIASAQQLDAAMVERNFDHVFFAIQNLLNAGANLSKLFWGSGGRKATEREKLRASIGVTNDSPLREVDMRNNFEHMDERIDRWWENSKNHNIADRLIGPRNMIAGFEANEIFRWFNPTRADVIFWGDTFNLRAIVVEAQFILPRLEEEAAKPHWD